jgi:hypothetical protein
LSCPLDFKILSTKKKNALFKKNITPLKKMSYIENSQTNLDAVALAVTRSPFPLIGMIKHLS